MKKMLLPALSVLVVLSLIVLTACGDDDPKPKEAPVISIDNAALTGAPGETVNATISGELDGEFVQLAITKYNGTDIDTNYGDGGTMTVTSGLPYNFSYVLGPEGLDGTAVRFQFVVTDDNELTGETNLVITTEATRTQLLTFFNWRYASLLYQPDGPDGDWVEGIATCETDNILSFNEDGTMGYEYGALYGPDNCGDDGCAGSCSSDGALDWDGWEFDATEDTLRAFRSAGGVPSDTVVWAITEFTTSNWKGKVDLGLWGIFEYGHVAVAKE